jgi:hypothetical protein
VKVHNVVVDLEGGRVDLVEESGERLLDRIPTRQHRLFMEKHLGVLGKKSQEPLAVATPERPVELVQRTLQVISSPPSQPS